MLDKNYILVSKKEFIDFINAYPRKLIYDCYGVYEPPLITYNDFLLGKWPDSIVARTYLYDDDKNSPYYELEEKKEYYILKNYNDFMLQTEENLQVSSEQKQKVEHLTIKGIKDCSIFLNGEKISITPFTLECDINLNNVKGGTGSPVII